MPNNMPHNGLETYDTAPAAWAALGRRGDKAAMDKAKRLSKSPAPDDFKSGSTNHEKVQALINATVWKSYGLALTWHERMRKHGLGEGGPLYGPAGNFGYSAALLACALRDGREDVVRLERETLAWYRDYCSEIAVPRPGSIVAILKDGKPDSDARSVQGGPNGHVFMGGSRAAFSGIGWYYEAQATNLYQWLANTPGRALSARLAKYTPTAKMAWESWPWLTAMLLDLIQVKADAQPRSLSAAFRAADLGRRLEIDGAGPLKCKWRTEVVRFQDGSAFWTTDRATASPKPPASVIEYTAGQGLKIYIPDGYRNEGCTGKGTIEYTGANVWAEAVADGQRPVKTLVRPRSTIISHRVYPAKGIVWQDGKLHPRVEPPAPPPGPGPNPSEPPNGSPRDDRDWHDYPGLWLTKLWRWIEARF